jgi:hypothetical protein
MRTQTMTTSAQSISIRRDSIHNSLVHIANICEFASVARVIRKALPENAKISKEFTASMQECVSEFISFITSEGVYTLTLYNFQYVRSLILN